MRRLALGFMAMVAAIGLTGCGQLTEWDGTGDATFSVANETTVHISGSTSTSCDSSIDVEFSSDSGVKDTTTLVGNVLVPDTLVLSPGNWTVDGVSSDDTISRSFGYLGPKTDLTSCHVKVQISS